MASVTKPLNNKILYNTDKIDAQKAIIKISFSILKRKSLCKTIIKERNINKVNGKLYNEIPNKEPIIGKEKARLVRKKGILTIFIKL